MENNQPDERWCLNLDWYRENGCSIYFLAKDYLCAKCQKKLKKEVEAEVVIKTVSGCCARKDDFFTPNAPVLACIFQVFLANGNKPLSLEELGKALADHRDAAALPASVLGRLLKSDRYYGFHAIRPQKSD
ncbi:MAG: hypothetical protein V1894_02820 [Chloroflexota bacterium]